jgi:hypothetical protein
MSLRSIGVRVHCAKTGCPSPVYQGHRIGRLPSVSPEISVARISSEPMNEAIFRPSSARNSWA